MLIVLALVAAAAVGLGLHAVLPLRSTRGIALAPLLDAAIAAVIYTSLTWVGMTEDNPWLWIASIAVPAVVTAGVILVLSRTRDAHDERERRRLKIG